MFFCCRCTVTEQRKRYKPAALRPSESILALDAMLRLSRSQSATLSSCLLPVSVAVQPGKIRLLIQSHVPCPRVLPRRVNSRPGQSQFHPTASSPSSSSTSYPARPRSLGAFSLFIMGVDLYGVRCNSGSAVRWTLGNAQCTMHLGIVKLGVRAGCSGQYSVVPIIKVGRRPGLVCLGVYMSCRAVHCSASKVLGRGLVSLMI